MAAVIHVKKGSGSSGGLGGHIDRTYQVKNADQSKQHLNFYVARNADGKLKKYSKNPRKGSIHARCLDRIQNSMVTRKIQKNAVTRLNFMLSASNDEMKKIEASGKLDNWVAANYKFIADKFGEQNIVEFAIHRDEKTPHIHAVIVPILKDTHPKTGKERERLTARELLLKKGDVNRLSQLQEEYSKLMRNFSIERRKKGSRAIHIDPKAYRAAVKQQIQKEEFKEAIKKQAAKMVQNNRGPKL